MGKKKKKSKREYKHKDWKGTIRAMITKHPDKFDPDASGEGPKLNPYAIATAMKKKGAKPGYKPQKSTLEGKPKKKKVKKSFKEWLELREAASETVELWQFRPGTDVLGDPDMLYIKSDKIKKGRKGKVLYTFIPVDYNPDTQTLIHLRNIGANYWPDYVVDRMESKVVPVSMHEYP